MPAWAIAAEREPVQVAPSLANAKTFRSGSSFDRPRTLTRVTGTAGAAPRLARAGAFALDAACVAVVSMLCLYAGAVAFGLDALRGTGSGDALRGAERLLLSNPSALGACLLLVWAIASSYAIWFVGAGGRTPGMTRFGLRAVALDGSALGFSGAVSRWGAVLLAALPLGLGLAWTVFDSEGRGLHDYLAGTRVVAR